MNFIRRRPRDRPYAANSTGRHRGSLKTRKGRMSVFEAKGPAREKFANEISGAIAKCLRDNSTKLQDSASYVGWSLFMMGKSADQTKPVVMLVSEDKQARVEAFRLIKDSGIMDEYPGFDLGEMPLKAEFENLRPLSSSFAWQGFNPYHDDESVSMLQQTYSPEPGQSVFSTHPIMYADSKYPSIFIDPSLDPPRTARFGTPLVARKESTSFTVPDESIEIFGGRGVLKAPSGESATTGGFISYKGRYFAHTVDHFLRSAQSIQAKSQERQGSEDSEIECEIMGLSDSEEEDDGDDITSRASQTPHNSDGEDSDSDISELSQSSGVSSASLGMSDGRDPDSPLSIRLESRVDDAVAVEGSDPLLEIGNVVATSKHLDSSFVRVSTSDISRPQAIPLKAYEDHIETEADDVPVQTVTNHGEINGTLSGTPFFVRLPGTSDFQKVYTAKMNKPLRPGDCGCWIKTVQGKLFGHVIAGSLTSGQVLIMPAARVFAQLLEDVTTGGLDLDSPPMYVPPTWGLDKYLTNPVGISKPPATKVPSLYTSSLIDSARSSDDTSCPPPETPPPWEFYQQYGQTTMGSEITFANMGPISIVNSADSYPNDPEEEPVDFTRPSPVSWDEYPPLPDDSKRSIDEVSSEGGDVDQGAAKRWKSDDDGDYRPSKKPSKAAARTPSRIRRRVRPKWVPPPSQSAILPRRINPRGPKPETLSCSEPGCLRATFPDQAALDAHVKKRHTRPYICVFHFAGCESTFASKNEWKRHVSSQHLLLHYWICQEDDCAKQSNGPDPHLPGPTRSSQSSIKSSAASSPSLSSIMKPPRPKLSNGVIFNRKDLYTQHMRRMHMPEQFKKKDKDKDKSKTKTLDGTRDQEWEDLLRRHQESALRTRCTLPEHMTCPAHSCSAEFRGPEAWDQRMEHVARHLDRASQGTEPPVIFGSESDDACLVDWASREDVGIIERVNEKWVLRGRMGMGGYLGIGTTMKKPLRIRQEKSRERENPKMDLQGEGIKTLTEEVEDLSGEDDPGEDEL